MTALTDKLILGTAQFGLHYGITNTAGKPSLQKVKSILSLAHQAGILTLDTAAAYGDSEARLGKLLPHFRAPEFDVITKVGAGPAKEVAKQLSQSFQRLGRQSLYGVLFHDFAGQQQWPEAWQILSEAQDQGQVRKIGVSVYHPWQAEWLLEQNLPVSLLQIPFNVLDQRFLPLLPTLAKAGIEVHARSAFLQGLLLRPASDLPDYFKSLQPKLAELQQVAKNHDLPIEALLLLFAVCTPNISKVVIGVDSVENLGQNLEAERFLDKMTALQPLLAAFAEQEETFILPYLWPR